jgi:hypothetical protein
MSIKRLNYFNHQFLEEQDFRDEQQYHIEMRRHLNRSLHIWGIAEGLEVTRTGNREVTVGPGFAIDREGRELIVATPVAREISSVEHHKTLHLLLHHKERKEETDRRSSGGVEGYNRITEYVELGVTHEADKFGSGVLLATIHLDEEGNISHVDHAGRQLGGSLIAPNSVHIRHLADGCVTGEKLSPRLLETLKPEFQLPDESVTMQKLAPELRTALGASGWVRLPFKPVSLRPKGYRPRQDEGEFYVDVAYAHCDGRGASGTMAIPVPAGATAVREFRIAGTSRGRRIRVQLFRTGWNPQDRKGEATEILNKDFIHAEFDHRFPVEKDLDLFHALSLAIFADGETEIWLVAARFQ